MRTESRLLDLLGEVAIFNAVLAGQIAVASCLRERNAAITGTHLTIGELGFGRIEAELLRDLLAQLDAGGIDAGGRIGAAELAAGACGDREVGITKAHH